MNSVWCVAFSFVSLEALVCNIRRHEISIAKLILKLLGFVVE